MSDRKEARCPLCGFEFEWTEGITCAGCAWRPACTLVRCPACSYEFPAEGYPASRLFRWLTRLFGHAKRRSPEDGGVQQIPALESGHSVTLNPEMLEMRRRRLMEWVVTEFSDLPEMARAWSAIDPVAETDATNGPSRGLMQSVDILCTRLGHPRYCPHGKPIPVGACCLTNAEPPEDPLFRTLKDLEPGETARVLYLSPRQPAHFYRLTNMGFTPGALLILQQKYPVRVLRIGRAQIALDDAVAERVFVRPVCLSSLRSLP